MFEHIAADSRVKGTLRRARPALDPAIGGFPVEKCLHNLRGKSTTVYHVARFTRILTAIDMWLTDRPDIRQLVSRWMLSTLGPRFGIDVAETDFGKLADVKGIGVMMIERLEAREHSIREEGKLEGAREGEQRALMRQLKHKFGDVSHEVEEMVGQASLCQLERWLGNVLDAKTRNEIFADSDAM